MASHTVLIVNDDRQVQQLLERYVSETGFQAVSVETSEEALVFLRLFEPDLIFVNMHLNNMQALSLLKRLEENPHTSPIPVFIVALFHTSLILHSFLTARVGGFLLLLSGEAEHMMAQIRQTVAIALRKNDQGNGRGGW